MQTSLHRNAILIPLLFTGFMWVIHLVGELAGLSLYRLGVFPRTIPGLIGVFTMPLIHADWIHLISNTLPILILGYLYLSIYRFSYPGAILHGWWLTGIWVWISARPSWHVGASGLIYFLAFFLLVMGLLRRNRGALGVSLVVVFLYGGLIWGMFPVETGISWEGHLFGALAGLVVALFYYKYELPEKIEAREETLQDFSGVPYYKYEVEGDLKPPYKTGSTNPQPGVHYRYHIKQDKKEDQ